MSDKTNNRKSGIKGEKTAIEYLRKIGYQIIETNYRLDYGEIDIIARDKHAKDGDSLVFVEVKNRENKSYPPEEAITSVKINKIKQVSEYFSNLHPELPKLLRLDVIAIEQNRLTHYLNVEL